MVKPMIHYGEDGARATILASGWIDATYLIEAINEVTQRIHAKYGESEDVSVTAGAVTEDDGSPARRFFITMVPKHAAAEAHHVRPRHQV